MKKISTLGLMLVMILCFAGCGAGSSGGKKKGVVEVKKEEQDSIKIEDLEWNVEDGIIDRERKPVFEFKNHSDYTIISVYLGFAEKEGLTEEEKQTFLNDVQKEVGLSKEELKELEEREISMSVEEEQIVEPGASITGQPCYYEGYFTVQEMSHYELVKPDFLMIRYIKDDLIYTENYDYVKKEYSVEDDVEKAYYWTEYEIGNKIPKPDAVMVENIIDDEEMFTFKVYGITLQKFNSYRDECKNLGYKKADINHKGFYIASDQEGYELSLSYDEDDHSMHVSVDAPEEEKDE